MMPTTLRSTQISRKNLNHTKVCSGYFEFYMPILPLQICFMLKGDFVSEIL